MQEVAKLQEALHTMRLQLKETTAMVVKEQEAARVAIEEACSVNKEPVVVEDTEKIDSLSNEIDRLKVKTDIFNQIASRCNCLCTINVAM